MSENQSNENFGTNTERSILSIFAKSLSSSDASKSLWYRHSTKRSDKAIRSRIVEIANTRIRYGVNRIHVLLRSEGWKDNIKACTPHL